MELFSGMGVSTTVPSPQSPQFSDRYIHLGSTEMGKGIMESGCQITGISHSLSAAQSSTSLSGCADRDSAASCPSTSFGGLEDTGWSMCTAGWLPEEVEFLERSWRKSSLETYAAP